MSGEARDAAPLTIGMKAASLLQAASQRQVQHPTTMTFQPVCEWSSSLKRSKMPMHLKMPAQPSRLRAPLHHCGTGRIKSCLALVWTQRTLICPNRLLPLPMGSGGRSAPLLGQRRALKPLEVPVVASRGLPDVHAMSLMISAPESSRLIGGVESAIMQQRWSVNRQHPLDRPLSTCSGLQ
jgi:hypothetical protein